MLRRIALLKHSRRDAAGCPVFEEGHFLRCLIGGLKFALFGLYKLPMFVQTSIQFFPITYVSNYIRLYEDN